MRRFIVAFLIFSIPGAAAAQTAVTPDISGTWTLQSDADAARNRRPINGLSIATELVIRQAGDEIAVDSNTGTAGAIVTTTHKVGGGEYPMPGPIGWDTRAKSAWQGTTFAVDIRRSVQGPDGELVFEIRERYSRADDLLTLERTMGRTTQRLVYKAK
jgi:hypothetical protein